MTLKQIFAFKVNNSRTTLFAMALMLSCVTVSVFSLRDSRRDGTAETVDQMGWKDDGLKDREEGKGRT